MSQVDDASPVWIPVVVGDPSGRYMPAWMRPDGRGYRCRWFGCAALIEGPNMITGAKDPWAALREHAKTHGVSA